jgi:hypothetical protein
MAYNDYEKLDPYHQYGDPEDPSPYEILNQMKSWNKAITLQVVALDESTQASLKIMDDRITAEITDVTDDMNTQLGVMNGQILLKVTKGESIADINVTQGLVKIRADKVELSGYATFTALATDGMTAIHGGNILTETIVASKIGANQISSSHIQTDAITANELAANAVYAGAIQTNAVNANHIQSNSIETYHIQSYAITAGKIDSYAITADKIAAGQISANHIVSYGITADVINGGEINSSTINVDTNATVGKVLNIGTHYSDMDGRMIRFGGGTGGTIGYSYDQITLGAQNGVRINGDLFVDTNNSGNVAISDTNGLSFGVSEATTPPRLYVRLYGRNIGYTPLT